jgi:3-oxoacyl-[acyl-carrier-protein] synthase-3
MSERRATMRSLSVAFPRTVRTNDFFRREHPEVVASAEERALGKVWNVDQSGGRELSAFEIEMLPYLNDPFRGTVERRVLAANEPALGIELPAARAALEGAGMEVGQIDLLISCSFPSDQVGIGESAFLARDLGLRGAAWNLESACSSALVGLDVASTLVSAGRYDRVLVVTGCVYSRVTEPSDTLAWTIGDGAAAFVIAEGGNGAEVLGARNVHTAESCGALSYELLGRPDGAVMRMKTFPGAADALRDIAETSVDECCRHAADVAGVSLKDIRVFACNAPAAWFSAFIARRLGVDRERVVNTYPRYANIGPVLWPAALHDAASSGRLKTGDLVMLYSIGSVASSSAAVLRWGDVGVREPPRAAEIRL